MTSLPTQACGAMQGQKHAGVHSATSPGRPVADAPMTTRRAPHRCAVLTQVIACGDFLLGVTLYGTRVCRGCKRLASTFESVRMRPEDGVDMFGVHGRAGRTAAAAEAAAEVAAPGEAEFETLSLRLVHKRRATGFEDTQEMPLAPGDVIAGRYQVPIWRRSLPHFVVASLRGWLGAEFACGSWSRCGLSFQLIMKI